MIHWRDGELREGTVGLDPAGPAFRSGVGVYETLLYDGNVLLHLDRHLARMDSGLCVLGVGRAASDAELADAAAAVIACVAPPSLLVRVNIFCPVEDWGQPVRPVVLAAPLPPLSHRPWRLVPASEPLAWPLAAQKSISAAYLRAEGRRAERDGADDAVLRHPDGRLLETTRASLLLRDDIGYVVPAGPALPGVALALAREILPCREELVLHDDLGRFNAMFVLNSLVGMRPVARLGEVEFKIDDDAGRAVDGIVLGRAAGR